jgi:hypothetical protein
MIDQRIKDETFRCFICKEKISEFNVTGLCKRCYRNERRKDDEVYKENARKSVRKYQAKNKERLLAHRREYAKRPDVKEKIRRYYTKNKDRINKNRREKRQEKKNETVN